MDRRKQMTRGRVVFAIDDRRVLRKNFARSKKARTDLARR